MKTSCLIMIALLFACHDPVIHEDSSPTPPQWGPEIFQIDAFVKDGSVFYYARQDEAGHLHYSLDPVHESDLPFKFYQTSFQRFQEFLLSSTIPIRSNWFRLSNTDCLETGQTTTGIEFAVASAREKGYFLNARLDSAYWNCLKETTTPLHFSFQLLATEAITPTRFSLQGFYNWQRELLHLKAKRDTAGVWYPTGQYQVFQEPGPRDFTIHISKHPQLGAEQSLLRIGSAMPCITNSVWIGLPGECLDQADWEVHSNRYGDRFLLDVIVPDCYLDCLRQVANGFEFAVEFFQ